MVKVLVRSGIQGPYLSKGNIHQTSSQQQINGEKLEGIPQKTRTRLSLYLFNIVLKVLVRENNKRRSKGYKLERKKSKYHNLQMI